MPSEAPAGDDLDLESHTDFLECLDTAIVSEQPDNVEELKHVRKRKMKAGEKTLTRSRLIGKENLSQCVYT